jgi:hypothetical protein
MLKLTISGIKIQIYIEMKGYRINALVVWCFHEM